MDVDQELYSTNPFYKQLIDQIVENERKCEELRCQIESMKHEMVQYANQIPHHTMSPVSPYKWSAPYGDFESNYTGYWANRYPEYRPQCEQQWRQNFKAAIDVAASATKDSFPVASIVFDGIGILTADNLWDALVKTLTIIDKVHKQ